MEGRKSFLLRMDPELWRELEGWAQEEMRSVNGQIEYLLKQAVLKRKRAAEAASPAAEHPRHNELEDTMLRVQTTPPLNSGAL
jgi:hypothetical protein